MKKYSDGNSVKDEISYQSPHQKGTYYPISVALLDQLAGQKPLAQIERQSIERSTNSRNELKWLLEWQLHKHLQVIVRHAKSYSVLLREDQQC